MGNQEWGTCAAVPPLLGGSPGKNPVSIASHYVQFWTLVCESYSLAQSMQNTEILAVASHTVLFLVLRIAHV